MSKQVKCAIYTRKSCEEGLEQAFNSLDAQRLAGESYIQSQQHEGWIVVDKRYDDGGYSGGTLERPALQELFKDIENAKIDCVVVYKIDRLSRSLLDFAKIVDLFDKHKVTFVSVTQSFNTANSMGRLMLNIVLSFAQYERELTGERIRDKFAASKQKGIWMGGPPPLGFDIEDRKLIINENEAKVVRYIFTSFLGLKSTIKVARELNKQGHCTKRYQSKSGCFHGGLPFKKATVHSILTNPIYNGYISYKGKLYPGQHQAIIDDKLWDKVKATFNAPKNNKSKVTTIPLLQGIIRCHSCQVAMQPTYTKKRNKNYCYYVCRSHIQGLNCASSNRTIPAGEIEQIVITHVPQILKNSANYHKELSNISEETWHNLFWIEQHKIIRQLIKTLWICTDGIKLCTSNNDKESIFIPVTFKKCGARTIIVDPKTKDEEVDDTLLKALVRADLWKHKLNNGEFATLQDLCNHESIGLKYAQYILRLNFLAPKIKEDILNGTQPRHLRLMDFKKNSIPLLWSEQEEIFYG
ncbi:recombinase family protein [Candidatus Mesenet endosymbiont of Phosphuga atrata]|uniref:recombinase family protein n=1 Tax=Candidatus Mesenet endosymbiont of Phosphuga atrata TaxID=3066221 RepID=UPI0030D4A7D2